MTPAWIERVMQIPGFMEPEELAWLRERAAEVESVVEVGCWYGRSAAALTVGCPTGRVWTVDHFQGSPSELDAAHAEARTVDIHARAREYLAPYGTRIIADTSIRASRLFPPASVDLVFLDGEHTRDAVMGDLLAWGPKARRLLCGHDLNWDGVAQALALYGAPYECGPGSLWFVEMVGR